MKVKIETTVDIDPAKWVETYGCEDTPEAIRKDVKAYFQNGCDEQLLSNGCAAVQHNPEGLPCPCGGPDCADEDDWQGSE